MGLAARESKPLSERQLNVLWCVFDRLANREIAARVGISEGSVKAVLGRIHPFLPTERYQPLSSTGERKPTNGRELTMDVVSHINEWMASKAPATRPQTGESSISTDNWIVTRSCGRFH